MAALKYWVWLSGLRLRPSTCLKLLEDFSSPEKIYFARDEEFEGKDWLNSREKDELGKKSLIEAKDIILSSSDKGYRIMTINDAEYPSRLKNIYDPPILLYIKGTLPEIDEEACIAIVGTRSCTPYGIKTAERMGYEIARGGGIIVTGLARGIDSAAAKGALRAGGKVIGVLGCGLDVVYPPENKSLFEDVGKVGAIISEFPPKTEPYRGNFPRRNRIMSGISAGVLVVEAPEKSGALITAAQALDQGRDVFAIPGNVDADGCKGSNNLLKEGAIAVTEGGDILDHYISLYPGKIGEHLRKEIKPIDKKQEAKLIEIELPKELKSQKIPKKVIDNCDTIEYIDLVDESTDLTEDEMAVVSAMKSEAAYPDEIVEHSGLAASKVLSALTMLELRGYVAQKQGKRFVLSKKEK